MRALAVICEYDPFHSGHAYHIAAARKQCDADTVIGLMSGCFTQRAAPAVLPPADRAVAALQNGMDAVIALPTAFSCAPANVFARGAVHILSRIPWINYLGMGAEDDGALLKRIADVQCGEPPAYRDALRKSLDEGLSYPVALTAATQAALPFDVGRILHKPNNVLAVEYLKALSTQNSAIAPVFVQRRGAYHSERADGEFISATAARALLQNRQYDTLARYIPAPFLSVLKANERHFPNKTVYDALLLHALRTRDVALSADTGEGLEHRLRASAQKYAALDDVLRDCGAKRYPTQRLLRMSLQTLLGITHQTVRSAYEFPPKLLTVRNDRKDILRELRGVAVRNGDYRAVSADAHTALAVESDAYALYALLTARDGNPFWDERLRFV